MEPNPADTPHVVPELLVDHEEIPRWAFDQLFDGITLSPEAKTRAIQLIRADSEERRLLVRENPGRWHEQSAMMERLYTALRALIKDPADVEKFDTNLERFR